MPPAYEPHQAPEWCREAVYGLSELYKDDVASARLVGNPGCYPTCSLLPLLPLVKRGWIRLDDVIIDAKSGISGAGRGVGLGTHYCEVAHGFKAYKVGAHRHRPEIAACLSKESGQTARVTFTPHLVPTIRGMLVTSYTSLCKAVSEAGIRDAIAADYKGRPFVRVLGEGAFPDLHHVAGTNLCDIGVRVDPESGKLILVSAIDNLVKGAAGQAVQNMNLMFGLDEAAGLSFTPFPV